MSFVHSSLAKKTGNRLSRRLDEGHESHAIPDIA
jgi:hypothetical protein